MEDYGTEGPNLKQPVSDLTESDWKSVGLSMQQFWKWNKAGIWVSAVSAWLLCNGAVREGAAQSAFRKTSTETLWWVHRAIPPPILVQWCQLGWDPLEPLCRGLHTVTSFNLGTWCSDTRSRPAGSGSAGHVCSGSIPNRFSGPADCGNHSGLLLWVIYNHPPVMEKIWMNRVLLQLDNYG